jgi:hypothetical protein
MVSKKITKAQANVRISKDKPNQVVKFKMLGAGTVRATARGGQGIRSRGAHVLGVSRRAQSNA